MGTKKINSKIFLIILSIALVFINTVSYMLLLSKNREWKTLVTEKNHSKFELAEALSEHVYYDGDSILCSQTVKHYSRSGKLIENISLNEVLCGDKVVMLLSPNCCSGCAKIEIEKLLGLTKKIGRKNLVIIAENGMCKWRSWTTCFDKEGFYETGMEHLGLEGSPTKETPLLLLTQNGRIKTSFVVGQQTSEFVDGFHEYLVDYYKGKK